MTCRLSLVEQHDYTTYRLSLHTKQLVVLVNSPLPVHKADGKLTIASELCDFLKKNNLDLAT
jgi:hypothetical protein